MDLAKNKCNKGLSITKDKLDGTQKRIKYVRDELENMIDYIKNIKKHNPDCSIKEIEEVLYYNIKKSMMSLKSPTRSDMYLHKTVEYALKDMEKVFYEIENSNRENFIRNNKKEYIYTCNIEENIGVMTEDILTSMLSKLPDEFKQKFVDNTLTNEQNENLKKEITKHLKMINEIFEKEMKKKYCLKLADTVKLLDGMGALKKYNDINNSILDKMNCPWLKYEYKADKNKIGLIDLTNPEFINRFSTEDIIGMTSFYINRLAKEVNAYNESLYIANKLGIINEVFETGDCKLKVTDEELREILAQLGFVTEFAKKVTNETADKLLKQAKNKGEISRKDENSLLEKNIARKEAKDTYETDYNELYNNCLLTQIDNDFETDLDFATLLEIDRHNLYMAKDYAMESLMIILTDRKKNNEINWGYIPEYKEGRNSIQNKEKFILIGVDMKGYNMPIKLHFERERLKTFLTQYAKNTKLPIYEGNEDMVDSCNGFLATQICMPLTKQQRKELKAKNIDKADYRYKFLEHIKWMMFPNRYPEYLCDDKGNKKPTRYIDIINGRMDDSGDAQELYVL